MLSAFKVFASYFDVLQSSKCDRAAVCKTLQDAGFLYHCCQIVNLQSVFGALQFSFGPVLWPELGAGSINILMALTRRIPWYACQIFLEHGKACCILHRQEFTAMQCLLFLMLYHRWSDHLPGHGKVLLSLKMSH